MKHGVTYCRPLSLSQFIFNSRGTVYINEKKVNAPNCSQKSSFHQQSPCQKEQGHAYNQIYHHPINRGQGEDKFCTSKVQEFSLLSFFSLFLVFGSLTVFYEAVETLLWYSLLLTHNSLLSSATWFGDRTERCHVNRGGCQDG